jgi:hypothetical protein
LCGGKSGSNGGFDQVLQILPLRGGDCKHPHGHEVNAR